MCENEYDIWTAASVGDIEFIKENITSKTENVNNVNLGQWSCLMYASYYDHSDLVKYLLFSGAEVHKVVHREILNQISKMNFHFFGCLGCQGRRISNFNFSKVPYSLEQ